MGLCHTLVLLKRAKDFLGIETFCGSVFTCLGLRTVGGAEFYGFVSVKRCLFLVLLKALLHGHIIEFVDIGSMLGTKPGRSAGLFLCSESSGGLLSVLIRIILCTFIRAVFTLERTSSALLSLLSQRANFICLERTCPVRTGLSLHKWRFSVLNRCKSSSNLLLLTF